jgi:hypothetical protein
MPDDIDRLTGLLQRELKARGIGLVEKTDDGHLVLDVKGAAVTVSIEELMYDFERDADPQLVARFVASLTHTSGDLPAWRQARPRLFLAAENAQASPDDDRIVEPVTELLRLTVLHADEAEHILTPVTEAQVKTWQVSAKDIFQSARANLAGLVEETPFEQRMIGKIKVGTFATRSVFKTAFIFSPNFQEIVAPKLGWPLFAFLPCREMLYLLPCDALNGPREVTAKFLTYMVHEYLESRYGLTMEVLLVDDEGVKGVGLMGLGE